MSLSIILKVYDGGKLKLARAFQTRQIRLGQGDVELQLDGDNVSDQHAVIEAKGSSAVLRALSDLPVFLNGQPILAAPLRTGDLVTIGALRVMVELREPQQQPAAPHQAASAAPQKRQRFQVIDGEMDEADMALPHIVPSLQVVREDELQTEPRIDHISFAPAVTPLPQLAPASPPSAAVIAESPAAATRKARLEPHPVADAQHASPLIAQGSVGEIGYALVELRWGDQVLGVHCLEPGRSLSAGTDAGCDAFLPGIGRAELVTSDGTGWLVRAPAPITLSMASRGVFASGRELLARGWGRVESDGLTASLPEGSCGVLTCGALSMRVRVVPEAAKVSGAREDWKGIAATTFAATALVSAMFILHKVMPAPRSPPPVQELRRGLLVRAAPAPKKELKMAPTPQKQAQARRDPGKAFARHRGTEGEAGSLTAPRRNLRAEKTRSDAAIVAESGLMKALKGKGKGVADAFGTALATGTKDALGHLDGPKAGDARGDMGAGLKSLGGTGGGGDGSGLGLARIGTNGIGGGLADYGEGRGALKGKANAAIGLGTGKPQIIGEIDPELIRKVVHDHRAQIRACYEQELNAKPKLAGKITSAWTIDPQGLVTEAHVGESTLGDSAVERCVTSRIKTWRFPLPKGGGEVYVTYPFLFTRGG